MWERSDFLLNNNIVCVFFILIGGHAKTLMFVHINPEINALGETISTLKFAERVASIELGAAKSNKETGEIRELKEEVCFSTILLTNAIFYSTLPILYQFEHFIDIKYQIGIGEERN
jgi:hypothetical protein